MIFSKQSRLFNIGVHYLDDNRSYFQMKSKACGNELFDCICQLLGLEEKDYFGLQFIDRNGNLAWLDNEKSLRRQIWHLKNRELLFRVKFYISDPSALRNEFTRYLFALQIAIDLKAGYISGSDTDIASMLAYILQADLGDYSSQNLDNIDLASSLPVCNDQIVEQCFEFYKLNSGMLKVEADLKLLEKSQELSSYGKRFYPCETRPASAKPLCICTDFMGVTIYEDDIQVKAYGWNNIDSVIFKGRKLVVLHRVPGSDKSNRADYFLEDVDKCRAYWKIVWENFSFYKDISQEKNIRVGRSSFIKRGSRFRYSGRTLSTMERLDLSLANNFFERSHSNRISMNKVHKIINTDSLSRENNAETNEMRGRGNEWSTPLISEQEINQLPIFRDALSADLDVVNGIPLKTMLNGDNGGVDMSDINVKMKFGRKKRLLVLAEPAIYLSSKRSLYMSTTALPSKNTESSNPVALNRTSSRGSIYSKRRLIRTNHLEIPRIYEIILELHASEYVYHRELTSLAHDFLAVVGSVVSEYKLGELKSQFIPLMEQHGVLCSLLSENLDQIHVEQLINCASSFFSIIFASFELYSDYLASLNGLVNNFLDALSSDSFFSMKCSLFTQQLYIPLVRLLLRPTQQLFYYQLILDGISSTAMSDDNHDLFDSFSGRLDQLLDEYDSQIQNTVEMLYMREFSAHIQESSDLLACERKFVRLGFLTVDSTPTLTILFSDLIIFCQPVGDSESFCFTEKIVLDQLENLTVESGCLFLLTKNGTEIKVETKTIEDKHAWVGDINHLLSALASSQDYSEATISSQKSVDPRYFGQGVLSTVWKNKICSLTLSDLFNSFKITFTGSVYRQTKLSKQRFVVLLNTSCLYFFTDYFSCKEQERVPECKTKLCILPAEISMRSIPADETTGEKYQFMIKLDKATTSLYTESRYSQNRWVVSIESASV